jgi:hypothetical protein
MSDPTSADRPAYEMVIEAGKVREFAAAVKSSDPAYLDDPNPVIPPTFLRAAAFWAPRRPPAPRSTDGGAAPARGRGTGLHGGQEYVFHGPPPRAGTRLSITSHVAERYEKQGSRGGTMTFTVSVQEFRDESGRLVAEGRTTSILTSKPTTEPSS